MPSYRQKDCIMNNNKNSKIEEILNSLDGVQKAAAPDFFYTRLKSRMEKELLQPQPVKKGILRPAFAFVALFLILLANAAVIFTRGNANETNSPDMDLQSFAAEYRLIDNSVALYDLNQDR